MADERDNSFVTDTDRLALELHGQTFAEGSEGLSRIMEVLDFAIPLTQSRRDVLFQAYADAVISHLADIDPDDITRVTTNVLGASIGLVEFLTNAVEVIQDKRLESSL